MARIVCRTCAISITLAITAIAVCGQTRDTSATGENLQTMVQQNGRIVSLLEQLADQARASDDFAFAVHAQSQAATLLWSQDPEQARSIYQRAFRSLVPLETSKSADERKGSNGAATSAEARAVLDGARKRQLRGELLNQIAARDPELAEELTRSLANSPDECGDNCRSNGSNLFANAVERSTTSTREEGERRELLMSAALQVVDREPQQAMAFAQMSVALGVSSNLARFLTLLRAVDVDSADLLFANAVARIERSSASDLTEIHTLGSYVVSVVNSASTQSLSKPLVVRFLNLALDRIARSESMPSAGPNRDQSAPLYFIGRQLNDLVRRYLPDRIDQLPSYMSDEAEAGTDGQAIDLSLGVQAPDDIARDAIEATDSDERDSLFARAALGWLARREVKDAQAAALRISGDATRDRVLLEIARRCLSEKRFDDALVLARRIVDVTKRAEILVMAGNAALAASDRVRGVELLNEAETYSMKARPSVERALSLIKIAGSFSAFDAPRSFESVEMAIRAINELIKQREDSKNELGGMRSKIQEFTIDDLYAVSLERTLASLAKADFDRALSLAQQLTAQEASVIAQLAVCRGGLVEKLPLEPSASSGEVDGSVNH